MITKTLARRLERLEEEMIPTGEPHILNVTFVKPDGTEAPGGFQVKFPAYSRAHDLRGRRPGQRNGGRSR